MKNASCILLCLLLLSMNAYSQTGEWQQFSNGEDVQAVYQQGDAFWIATEGGGLVSFDGENWEVFTPDNSGVPFGTLICVTVDNSTKKWIGSFGAGLAIYLENIPSGKVENPIKIIEGFVHHQNYPNPFNPVLPL